MMIGLHPSQSPWEAIHLCLCSIYWPNQSSGTIRGKDKGRKPIRKLAVTLEISSRTCWADVCSWSQSPAALLQYRGGEIQDQPQALPWTLHLPVALSQYFPSSVCWPGCFIPGRIFLYSRCLLGMAGVMGGIEWSGVSFEAQMVRYEALFLLERICLFLSNSWTLSAWDHCKLWLISFGSLW